MLLDSICAYRGMIYVGLFILSIISLIAIYVISFFFLDEARSLVLKRISKIVCISLFVFLILVTLFDVAKSKVSFKQQVSDYTIKEIENCLNQDKGMFLQYLKDSENDYDMHISIRQMKSENEALTEFNEKRTYDPLSGKESKGDDSILYKNESFAIAASPTRYNGTFLLFPTEPFYYYSNVYVSYEDTVICFSQEEVRKSQLDINGKVHELIVKYDNIGN